MTEQGLRIRFVPVSLNIPGPAGGSQQESHGAHHAIHGGERLAGSLQERLATRDLRRLGGLWAVLPRMGAAFLFFALASLMSAASASSPGDAVATRRIGYRALSPFC